MKLSKSKSHYVNDIPALVVATEIESANRSQSRPRVLHLLLVLVSVLTALVTVANVIAPAPRIGVGDEYNHLSNDQYGSTKQTIDDPYNRKILVLEHREEDEEDSEYEEDAEYENYEFEFYYEYEWSEEQMEEMERYYKRYLEVFYEKHGYGYEPEDIEVVYTEYLKFKEQKAQERLEREKQNEHAQITQTTPQEPYSTTKDIEEDVEKDQNEGKSSLESYEVRPTQYPDNTIIKHDPYYLEMEWEDFNEVGGDHFASNNYTETLTTVSVPTTIVVGRGQVYTV